MKRIVPATDDRLVGGCEIILFCNGPEVNLQSLASNRVSVWSHDHGARAQYSREEEDETRQAPLAGTEINSNRDQP